MTQTGAHIITVGNEKGGSGKSTTALHLAVYLLHKGYSVGTMDVDSRQQTLTRYMRNRKMTMDRTGRAVLMPRHTHVPTAWGDSIAENQIAERDIFGRSLDGLREQVEFIVIDTPGFDCNLAPHGAPAGRHAGHPAQRFHDRPRRSGAARRCERRDGRTSARHRTGQTKELCP